MDNCKRCLALKQELSNVPYYMLPDKYLGMGDVIARIAFLLNIKKCARCKIRHLWLNKWIPFFWAGTKTDRDIKYKLIKLDVQFFPVLTDHCFSRGYNIDDFFPGFTTIYPVPK